MASRKNRVMSGLKSFVADARFFMVVKYDGEGFSVFADTLKNDRDGLLGERDRSCGDSLRCLFNDTITVCSRMNEAQIHMENLVQNEADDMVQQAKALRSEELAKYSELPVSEVEQ